jgi:vacuolar-type H+-ATPase subunit F/Vma7
MQPHISAAYQFIDQHIPAGYVELTKKELKKAKILVTDQVIRNVRNQITTSNVDVLNALLKVAKAHQRKKKRLEKQLQE